MGSGLQASVIAAVALAGALLLWKVVGPPQRLADDEVELATVLGEWGGEVVWVDARKRAEWERNGLEGSVLINTDAAEDFDTLVAEALPQLAPAERVVIYCATAGCDTSRLIARRLREYEIGPEFYALHGGLRALVEAGLISGAN
jgi:rhodanese-related sulfurtransferase